MIPSIAEIAWYNFLLCSQNPTTSLSFHAGREMLWRPWNWSEERGGEAVNCPCCVNDIPVLFCCARCRKQSDNTSKVKSLWEVVYNSSCASICTWKAKNLEGTFQFRVTAANVLGLGEYSDRSKDIILDAGMFCTFLLCWSSFLFRIILPIYEETCYFNNDVAAQVICLKVNRWWHLYGDPSW